MLFYFLYPNDAPLTGFPGSFSESILPSSSLLAHFTSLLLCLVISVLIGQVNNRYSYINTRTFLHTFIYLLISTLWVQAHGNYLAYFAALCVVAAIYMFFDMYGSRTAVEEAFLGSLFFSISIFLVPQYVFLFPLVWIGFYQLKSLSFRTFFASILGLLVPWLIIYIAFYLGTDQIIFKPDFSPFIKQFSIISQEATARNIYAALMLIILIIILFSASKQLSRESIKTRNLLYFIRIIGFGLLALMVLYSKDMLLFLPLAATFFSIVAAYTFTYNRSFFYTILFILLCVFSVGYTFYLIFF